MTEAKSMAPARPFAGVVHVRRRQTSNFTILSNRLALRPGSGLTVGIGAYLMAVPEGTVVSIDALRAHFNEGEVSIARSLRELEAEGYLKRVTVRTADGRIRARTYVHNDPHGERQAVDQPEHPQAAAPTQADATPEAVAVLDGLRGRDSRLTLSRRDVARLAPGVAAWLRTGAEPQAVARTLTADLPAGIVRNPAGLLAYRLQHFTPPPPPGRPAVPMQNCDGCDRAFRAPEPGLCRDCGPAGLVA